MERHPRYAPPVSAEAPKLGGWPWYAPRFSSHTTVSKSSLSMAARSQATVPAVPPVVVEQGASFGPPAQHNRPGIFQPALEKNGANVCSDDPCCMRGGYKFVACAVCAS